MAEKSIFIELFGDYPTVRLLDYLLTERNLDFSITDMAKNSRVGRATLYRLWRHLIKNKIIVHTRTIGRAKLYKLNRDNPKVEKLIEIDDMLILEELKTKSKSQKLTVEV